MVVIIPEVKHNQTSCAAADVNAARTELKVSSGLARCPSLSSCYLRQVLDGIMVAVQLGSPLSLFSSDDSRKLRSNSRA